MINRILKMAVLSSALALCVMLLGTGCGTVAPSSDPGSQAQTTAETSSDLNAPAQTCAAFCKSEGGQFYLNFPASTQAACNQKGGDWYTAADGYTGPPPGCCCKCGLLNGDCL
ncbi:MAG TPA: hypothetical protein VH165_02445 [Kofleriaceae bacterium]|jgi:hypothetical protein|nr:hypothetical protein [Kofleriaceae bacterium]